LSRLQLERLHPVVAQGIELAHKNQLSQLPSSVNYSLPHLSKSIPSHLLSQTGHPETYSIANIIGRKTQP
jgi:hypothetical protein